MTTNYNIDLEIDLNVTESYSSASKKISLNEIKISNKSNLKDTGKIELSGDLAEEQYDNINKHNQVLLLKFKEILHAYRYLPEATAESLTFVFLENYDLISDLLSTTDKCNFSKFWCTVLDNIQEIYDVNSNRPTDPNFLQSFKSRISQSRNDEI